MSNLDKIQRKRNVEFSKARLTKSLTKFKASIVSSKAKLEEKHGKVLGTAITMIAVPVGIVIGLTCSKETVDKMVSKRTKKES